MSGILVSDAGLQRQTLSAQIYARLESSVLNGDLAPGTRLSEELLAENFGVSRAPVREALIALESAGLAERFGARDRVVTVPTAEFITRKYDLWWIIDVGRTYLASLDATRAECDEMHEMIAQAEHAAGRGDLDSYLSHCNAFHEKIRSGCRNPDVAKLAAISDIHLRWFESLYNRAPGISADTICEHYEILAAFRDQNYPRLADTIRVHMLRQRDIILREFMAHEAAPARNAPAYG